MYKFNTTLEPLWISRVTGEKGMKVERHSHDHYYHLIFVVSGAFDFIINGKSYVISENMMTIAKPSDFQSWQNNQEYDVISYEIKFTIFDNDLRDGLEQIPEVIYCGLFTKTLMDKIMDQLDNIGQNFQEYISVYINTLLYDLILEKVNNRREHLNNKSRLNPNQMVKQFINDNYSSRLSLKKIANACNYNESYLSALFKKVEGISINDYIYRFRIYKACELIAYSDLSLTSVSEMTGFKHIQHFSRTFKRIIGIPPSEYRDATPKEFINHENILLKNFNLEVLPVRSGQIFEVESDTGYFRKKTNNVNKQ